MKAQSKKGNNYDFKRLNFELGKLVLFIMGGDRRIYIF